MTSKYQAFRQSSKCSAFTHSTVPKSDMWDNTVVAVRTFLTSRRAAKKRISLELRLLQVSEYKPREECPLQVIMCLTYCRRPLQRGQ